MGPESLKLPIIDFSKPDMLPGTPVWGSVKVLVREVLEEIGCFEAKFDKIPLELRKALFDAEKELFDLPLQTKMRNPSKRAFYGYVGQYPVAPLFESMTIEDVTIPGNIENFTQLMWPQGNSNFCKAAESYSKQLSELDQMVRRMVLDSLGLEKYMDEHLESTDYVLRLMEYKGPQVNEPKLGLQAHTDTNFVTILHQNEVQGLEVLRKDGQWIQVQFSPDSYIVFIGDSFHAWTNGLLYAAYHRVMMTGNHSRYSVGLITLPKAGYKVKAPEELVDEDHPLLFKPFTYEEYLSFYYKEAAEQRIKSALKAYCGF